ncbi:hypothetical protein GLOTRDRAFT_110116 [Gloeophyllum trabeum ATCC 11539]|uniref:DUF3074 domain-containing protein n=1 Tax=Gloeophyllum trabeum (strain ATCC 11539 / FP-39264 / Madison 617) TaxID=670483 RepID=S7RU84_GLOTA|nr:uncharacterized protein GLOTRDRAFT_110116 [Gloeophyllum trabeum ATCC 11539]EPQ58285.1 hypothetical protein GLOTRDRAFT_110116 [Gloeophyllum trabeum ATCC 11539]
MSGFQLNITPLKPSAAAREVLESTKTWKQGKSFHKNTVKTYSRPKGPNDSAAWYCRVSEHTTEDATFDEFWDKLGHDKAQNEKEFIEDIKKVTLVKRISDTQAIWSMFYNFPPPISPRVFTVLQTVHLDQSSPRTGLIVSIPMDLSGDPELCQLQEKGVMGRYVSVERIQELGDGKVEWRMATSSTPGGRIPQFVADRSMAGKISDDVPHFLHWFHSVRSPSKTEAAPSSESASIPAPAATQG